MLILRQTLAGLRALLVLTVLCGIAYPLLVTGAAQLAPHRANGSLVVVDGRTAGSTSLGQAAGPQWFQARPSATGHDGASSGGTNLGAAAPELAEEVEARRAAATRLDPGQGPLPADALTASFSGLDPDISPEWAHRQVARVARERGIDQARLHALVDEHTKGRHLGFLGTARVNTVELNQALAGLAG